LAVKAYNNLFYPNHPIKGEMRMILAQARTFSVMLIPMLALIPWIIMLIAVWRAMKAHESIAESLRKIAEKQERS